MKVSPQSLWDKALTLISKNVSEEQFNAWFKPLTFVSFNEETKTLLVQVPSSYVCEYLEEHYVDLLSTILRRVYGEDVRMFYSVLTDKEHHLTQNVQAQQSEKTVDIRTRVNAKMPKNLDKVDEQPEFDSQLNPHQTFSNFIEGETNKFSRSIGVAIAEHPNKNQFNPMFVFGPSGCGKTHLINAIGMRIKQLYPQKRVLYVSARLFEVQYTDSIRQNTFNDFIGFYQTIDVLLVDDIQEWIGKERTQQTFFHIFDHLFRNGRRIVMACDRPPQELKGMPDRLITRFSCGLIAEMEKPNVQLCVDILNSKIRRDGLQIPADVVELIASTANGSIRDLEGVLNSLLAYSVVYDSPVDIKLAEQIIQRTFPVKQKKLTLDDILDAVCRHFGVTTTAVCSRSRKREFVVARQVAMYLSQKYIKMPASRIGQLIGGRDHSTVIHSCAQVEDRIKTDKGFSADIKSLEQGFRLKNSQKQ